MEGGGWQTAPVESEAWSSGGGLCRGRDRATRQLLGWRIPGACSAFLVASFPCFIVAF